MGENTISRLLLQACQSAVHNQEAKIPIQKEIELVSQLVPIFLLWWGRHPFYTGVLLLKLEANYGQFHIMFLKSAVATSMALRAAGVYLFLLQKPTQTQWSSHIANGSKNAETKGEASYIFFKHLIHSKLDFCRPTNV